MNPKRFEVSELVTSACDTVSPLIQEGVELRQDVAGDIGEANTDKARLQQMVINLLSNAIKFTDSGMVTVTAQREQGEGKPGKRFIWFSGSRFSSFLYLTSAKEYQPTNSLPSSMNTVRPKDRRAASRRAPGWDCPSPRNSRSC